MNTSINNAHKIKNTLNLQCLVGYAVATYVLTFFEESTVETYIQTKGKLFQI